MLKTRGLRQRVLLRLYSGSSSRGEGERAYVEYERGRQMREEGAEVNLDLARGREKTSHVRRGKGMVLTRLFNKLCAWNVSCADKSVVHSSPEGMG